MLLKTGGVTAAPTSSGARSRFRSSSKRNEMAKEGGVAIDHEEYPLSVERSIAAGDDVRLEDSHKYGEIISALSNFSIQYNLGVIAPALLLLDHTRSTY